VNWVAPHRRRAPYGVFRRAATLPQIAGTSPAQRLPRPLRNRGRSSIAKAVWMVITSERVMLLQYDASDGKRKSAAKRFGETPSSTMRAVHRLDVEGAPPALSRHDQLLRPPFRACDQCKIVVSQRVEMSILCTSSFPRRWLPLSALRTRCHLVVRDHKMAGIPGLGARGNIGVKNSMRGIKV